MWLTWCLYLIPLFGLGLYLSSRFLLFICDYKQSKFYHVHRPGLIDIHIFSDQNTDMWLCYLVISEFCLFCLINSFLNAVLSHSCTMQLYLDRFGAKNMHWNILIKDKWIAFYCIMWYICIWWRFDECMCYWVLVDINTVFGRSLPSVKQVRSV